MKPLVVPRLIEPGLRSQYAPLLVEYEGANHQIGEKATVLMDGSSTATIRQVMKPWEERYADVGIRI